MDKQKFVEQVLMTSPEFDPEQIENVVAKCLARLNNESPKEIPSFDVIYKMTMAVMEETAELVEAMVHRMRGRTKDNYDILEESADSILNILCVCLLFGIKTEDLQKAINVKCDRADKKTEW